MTCITGCTVGPHWEISASITDETVQACTEHLGVLAAMFAITHRTSRLTIVGVDEHGTLG